MFLRFRKNKFKLESAKPPPQQFENQEQERIFKLQVDVQEEVERIGNHFLTSYRQKENLLLKRCGQMVTELNNEIDRLRRVTSENEVKKMIQLKLKEQTQKKNELLKQSIELADDCERKKVKLRSLLLESDEVDKEIEIVGQQLAEVRSVNESLLQNIESHRTRMFELTSPQVFYRSSYRSPYRKVRRVKGEADDQSKERAKQISRLKTRDDSLMQLFEEKFSQFGEKSQALFSFIEEDEVRKMVYCLIYTKIKS